MTDEKQRLPLDPVEIGREAAVLTAVEIGLGTLLHALHLPLVGHFLSINQAFLLTRSVRRHRSHPAVRGLPLSISNVAAVLKSLSPAGKRLTPMLAIGMQGLLFSTGTLLFGASVPGVLLGSALLSLWAFAQPLLLLWLLFGGTVIQMAETLYQKSQEFFPFAREDLWIAAGLLFSLKVILGILAGLAACLLPESWVSRYLDRVLGAGSERIRRKALDATQNPVRLPVQSRAKLALRDLFQPLFLASFALTTLFLIYAEAPRSQLIWGLLRPLAVGFALFFLIRTVPVERIPGRFGKSLQSALSKLKSEPLSGP